MGEAGFKMLEYSILPCTMV